MSWNRRQQAVLDSIKEDKNVLVSAAAGSGKTAVLVERIVNSVEQGLCGIDEILVVTFTKAAAAQMKGKILAELEKRACNTADPRLIRQLSVAPNADISTIDSFCNRIVRENFQLAGVDPSYGMLDNGEDALMREEILDSVMEQLYKDTVFREFARAFTKRGYQDDVLRDVIMKVYLTADAFADPEKWLESTASSVWEKAYLREVRKLARQAKQELEQAVEPFRREAAPERRKAAEKITKALESDILQYEGILAASTIGEAAEIIGVKAENFASVKDYSAVYDAAEILALKARRDGFRKILRETYLKGAGDCAGEQADREAVISQLRRGEKMLRESLMLEKKRRKKYAFSDIAHFAYRVLYDTEKGEPTPVGRSYAERYRYIYIDEYQDGSDIQEQILTSVARMKDGYPVNIFMVGDVKQSIYRFRQARPQLFLEKEETYQKDAGKGNVLYLNQNYRSRKEILDAANHVFRNLMRKEFGGIDYNEAVQLNVPDDYDIPTDPEQRPEILLCENDVRDPEGVPLDNGVPEARMIGKRILELVQGGTKIRVKNEAFDKEKGESEENPRTILRPVRFGDIVILQSTLTQVAPMLREYERLGVPVQLEDPKAYFDAEEVVILLSLLQIIDNSRQDIPYAAVLRSAIGGFDDTEMTRLAMRRNTTACSLFDTASEWLEVPEEEIPLPEEQEICRKLRLLHGRLARWKKQAAYLSIAQLLDSILEETGFREDAARMPDGRKRLNNLTQLCFKAEDFEKAGNHGLFTFLRYIDQCRIHELEFGERGSLSEATDSVRICTIHSSKGLEYPVVFVSRLAREFNRKTYEGAIIVSADYGIAANRIRRINGKYWLSEKGLIKSSVYNLLVIENLHEQLRLLYVAMTRAEQRLFLTGSCKDLGEFMETFSEGSGTGQVDYPKLVGAKSYMDFLKAVLLADPEGAEQFFKVRAFTEELSADEVPGDVIKGPAETDGSGTVDASGDFDPVAVAGLVKDLKESYDFQYPYAASVLTGTKLSVSEIKHEAMEAAGVMPEPAADGGTEAPGETTGASESADSAEQADAEAAAARKEKKRSTGVTGAEYGTAVHKLMELLPFEKIGSAKEMQETLKELIRGPFFTENLRKALHVGKIGRFYSDAPDSLFQRMKAARQRGDLFTEQQFLVGLPARRLGQELPVREPSEETEPENRAVYGMEHEVFDPEEDGTGEGTEAVSVGARRFDTDETVALQGVIDGFFLETDEEGERYAVLMDYKTDRVDSSEELILRYRAQLSLYKETIESILSLPVREMWLYGFADGLGEIRVP